MSATDPSRPRKIRRDAKLLGLPEKDRKLVAGWLQSDGWQVCLQRIATQFQISCGKSALYAALAFWDSEERRDRVRAKALEQIASEAEEKGFTPQQRMAALDRRMAEIFAAEDQHAEYQNARYLMIADESARTRAELEKAKLRLKQQQIGQKDAEIAILNARFKRQTCELFVKWAADERAKAILSGSGTNAEKIEALGRQMFDDWNE